MYGQNLYFQGLSHYGYQRNISNFTPTFIPYYNSYNNNSNNFEKTKKTFDNKNLKENITSEQNEKDEKNYSTYFDETEKSRNKEKVFKFGPINITKESISLFGFSLAFDDLILLVLIALLLFESDCDYYLIIILGLMFFNISFSNLNILNL